MKLEYLNKHHLMKTMSTDDGLTSLAERVHDTVKTAFPSRFVIFYCFPSAQLLLMIHQSLHRHPVHKTSHIFVTGILTHHMDSCVID